MDNIMFKRTTLLSLLATLSLLAVASSAQGLGDTADTPEFVSGKVTQVPNKYKLTEEQFDRIASKTTCGEGEYFIPVLVGIDVIPPSYDPFGKYTDICDSDDDFIGDFCVKSKCLTELTD